MKGLRGWILTLLSIALVTAHCQQALAGSVTIVRSGAAVDYFLNGEDNYSLSGSSFPHGILLGDGWSSASPLYRILLPPRTAGGNQITSITVTVNGDNSWLSWPTVRVGTDSTAYSLGDSWTHTYTGSAARNLLTPAPDGIGEYLDVNIEANWWFDEYDLEKVTVTYEYSNVDSQLLERFQQTYDGYLAIKKYESDMVSSLWHTGAWPSTYFLQACQETLALADNMSGLSGSLFDAVKAEADCLENFQNMADIITAAVDYTLFWIDYTGPWESEVSQKLVTARDSLKTLNQHWRDRVFDGTVSADDVVVLNADIDKAKSDLTLAKNSLVQVADGAWWTYFTNNNNGGEKTAQIMLRSLTPLLNVTYNMNGYATELSYITALINSLVQFGAGDVYEVDNIPDQAKVIANGDIQNRSIHAIGDIDWVKFTLAVRSEITIQTNGASGDTELWLYGPNSSTNQVEYDDDDGNGLFSLINRTGSNALEPGTYYIKIQEYGNNDIISAYTLALTVTPLPHTITVLNTPTGPSSGVTGTSYTYATGGSSCSQGHAVEYQFDWGDGTQSSWGSSSRSKSWSNPGTYNVTARARCTSDTSIVSGWSSNKQVTIVYAPIITSITPTSGPKCTYMKITGQNFGTSTGTVYFSGGTGSLISWSDTVIYCRVPETAATGGVYVRTGLSFDSNVVTFTVTVPSTIYVSNTTNVPGIENGTTTYPFSTVQRGIDAASTGAEVVVAQGTYVENINFNGKAVTVRSTNPDDRAVVAATVIAGNHADSIVRFQNSEGPGSILRGFTIRDGGGYYGGGIQCYSSSPTISNNTITGNSTSYYGGGIFCYSSSPTISNNTITGNSANSFGGGIYCYSSSPTISNNTIAGNSARYSGGGIYCFSSSSQTISNCIIRSNTANEGPQLGGSLFGLGAVSVRFSNVEAGQRAADVSPENALAWGEGNIDVDPLFASLAIGDYHLKSQAGRWDPTANAGQGGWVSDAVTSPCIDAGDPTSAYGNEPAPNGGRINMGAFGNTPFASKSVPNPIIISALPDSGPFYTLMKITGSWFGVPGTVEIAGHPLNILAWSDTEIRCEVPPGTTSGPLVVKRLNGVESNAAAFAVTDPTVIYVDDDNTSGIENGTLVYPFSTVQRAINAATTNDTIIAATGTYRENIDFKGKAIIVRSTDPDSASIVAATIIDGNQMGSAVTFASGEGPSSILSGFTIRGGSGKDHFGGGVHCYQSSPVVEKNVIAGNTVQFHGGGIYCYGGSPTIRSNVIRSNVARWFGGGIACWNSTATISGNAIYSNDAHWYGGGLFAHGPAAPTIKNNVLYGNSGSEGAGIACIYYCSPTIENNTVALNLAERAGGGIYCGWYCSPTVKNMIVWANSAPQGPQMALIVNSSPTVSYSDTQGGQPLVSCGTGCALTWGAGNIDLDPLFASSTDFHEKSTGGRYLPSSGLPPENPAAWVIDSVHSPCIDAGDTASIYVGELLPNGGRINMGAYGNTAQASKSAAPQGQRVVMARVNLADAPHLIATNPELGSTASGVRVLTLTFDRTIREPGNAVEVYGETTGPHMDYKSSYDAPKRTLRLEWPSVLPKDAYEVRIIADAILSTEDNTPLDGEIRDPRDPESLPSGDGRPGRDAKFEFDVE